MRRRCVTACSKRTYPGQSVIRVLVATVELSGRGMLACRQLNDAADHDEGRGGEDDADVGELVAVPVQCLDAVSDVHDGAPRDGC